MSKNNCHLARDNLTNALLLKAQKITRRYQSGGKHALPPGGASLKRNNTCRSITTVIRRF